MKLITRSPNGQISQCKCYEGYRFEFGNIVLNLTEEELEQFKNYVLSIDIDYYLSLNKNAKTIKKLILHVGSGSVQMALNRSEFLEICTLLTTNNSNAIITNRYIVAQDLSMN